MSTHPIAELEDRVAHDSKVIDLAAARRLRAMKQRLEALRRAAGQER